MLPCAARADLPSFSLRSLMSKALGMFTRDSDGKMQPHRVHGHLLAALPEV
jgi:hypothetical protein